MVTYLVILALLVVLEIVYFKVADRFNIIDKPNERSSHTKVVLRGGGIIFLFGVWLWSAFFGLTFVDFGHDSAIGEQALMALTAFKVPYPWFLAGVTLAAGVSFIDDIHSLPDSVRLVAQFVAMGLIMTQLIMGNGQAGMENGGWMTENWYIAALIGIIGMIVCVGATNIYNFMDGINGITGGYSLAVLIPLVVINGKWSVDNGGAFIDESLLVVIGLSLLVFCFFNFRKKAKCFAGDVGSVGIALILLFCIGKLILFTGDVTWLMLMAVYGVDGVLTICHRIMLHENLGEAHRKHAYQIMANEMKIPHTFVATFYMVLQLAISFGLILTDWHWTYSIIVLLILCAGYVCFMREYYHLHEEYLKGLHS